MYLTKDDENSFAALFKKQLENKKIQHLTYKELAKFFQVSHMTVHNWLNNKAAPSITRLENIAERLNIHIDKLLPYGEQEGKYSINEKECELLESYNNLSHKQQELLSEVMQALKKVNF
jgi:transcriptional regulator with XRE-family HTH domain